MARDDVAIIVPAYNEGRIVAKNLRQILKKFKYVICIDDGSKDNTVREAERSGVIVLTHCMNLGQGGAIQTGIDYALTLPVDYFCTFDADGQHLLSDAERMLNILKKKKLDIVIGSRFLGKAKNIAKTKKRLLKLAVRFSNMTSGLKLTDTHNGLRVFNRYVAETIELKELSYQHASEFIDKIAKNKYLYEEAPNTIIYTEYSRTKGQSTLNAINMGLGVIARKIIK